MHDLGVRLLDLGFPRLISDSTHVEAILNAGMFLPAAALACSAGRACAEPTWSPSGPSPPSASS